MIEEWLNNNVPGYDSLGPEEIEAVMNFSFLWSFFERAAIFLAKILFLQ